MVLLALPAQDVYCTVGFHLHIMQVIEPLCRKDQNIAKNFIGKWLMTMWSFVIATANES